MADTAPAPKGTITSRGVGCLDDVASACAAAEAAFPVYRQTDSEQRAVFLECIAEKIVALGEPLIDVVMRESGLPRARLEGERGRTVGQLRLFAEELRSGRWQGIRVDPALPDRTPLPRPDLRMRKIPVGPVAVFGASNFPLAFSTAGGDTASALAAGCPVIVKGHPAHPETSLLVAGVVEAAVKACDLPDGVFSHIAGPGNAVGEALVSDPRIAAVGFTGSRAGGLAILKRAQVRPVPIPVYAEMSSINPVILLPNILDERAAALGTEFVASLTMGAGQFCTNPGLVVAVDGPGLDDFIAAAISAMVGVEAAPMLSEGISEAYRRGVEALAARSDVRTIARGRTGEGPRSYPAALFSTDAASFLADATLGDEVFGATSLIVRCRDESDLAAVLVALEGQLTATLHMAETDLSLAARLMPVLELKAGRILVNGWPTGVEVSHAMVHGGPYPASSDARSTSVGSLAIDRFLRPVCYQNLPEALLPREAGWSSDLRR